LLGGNDQYQSRAVSLAFGNEPSFIHSIPLIIPESQRDSSRPIPKLQKQITN
jgi:hypothetical protein